MKWVVFFVLFIVAGGWKLSPAFATTYEDYPSIRLRSLDKITARTLTFDAQVGSTVKFGDIYIKVQACKKPPAIEKDESAAFLQIWQVDKTNHESRWVFSGWMFASSPSLSAMSHPVYDVWVINCLGKDPEAPPVEATKHDEALPDEGTVPEDSVVKPDIAPEEQKEEPAPEVKKQRAEDVPYHPKPTEQPSHNETIEGIY